MTTETKTYSAMLYALAKEMRDEEGCATESPELVEQAAERMDTQTVTINFLTKQRDDLIAQLRPLITQRIGSEQVREAIQRAIASIGAVGSNTNTGETDLSDFERECCGTFFRTPHRSTCKKFRGKKENNSQKGGV